MTEKKPYLSPSTAKMLLDYPLPVAFHKIHHRKGPSDAMIFGSLVDALVTEPEKIEKEFKILEGDEANGHTKVGKEAKAKALANNQTPVKVDVFNQAKMASVAVMTHPEFLKLQAPEFQVKLEGSVSGVDSLGYADIVADDVILDLKVFNAQTFENPSRTIFNRKLHLQLWIYQQILRTNKRLGVMVCLSEEPYYTEIWWLDDDWLDLAQAQHRQAVEAYKEYLLFDPAHSVSGDSKTVHIEGWMK